MKPKVIVLDIETSPILADVWGLWKNNVGLNQVRKNSEVLSYAAKDLGSDDIRYMDRERHSEKVILKALMRELDRADIIIAHNGDKFDIPKIQGRALVHRIKPSSPFKTIDTLKVARREFGMPSNKLEFLLHVFGCKKQKLKKREFIGHELWTECLKNNPKAWAEMKLYNTTDITSLEELYFAMRPYIKNHPNIGIYLESPETVCPKCGSSNVVKRGFAYTNLSKFQRFQCKDCGGYGRMRTNLVDKEVRKSLGTNVL